jgi:hypothetical protein
VTIDRRAGPWLQAFPLVPSGEVAEGLVVWSLLGLVEGRTTGSRRPCSSHGCPGWFIGVNWETGQPTMHICSEGWTYDAASRSVRITGGGEISARFVSPKPLGVPPLPRWEWPPRATLAHRKGWRVAAAAAKADRHAPSSPLDSHGRTV